MRILFFGTGDFAVPALRALRAAGHDVLAVVSQPDRPAGRGRQIVPTPVHAAADELKLPHIQAEDVNASVKPNNYPGVELGVIVAFGQKIAPALLHGLPRGFINVHGSLLPKYRGAAPFQWAILSGDDVTGVTAFQLDEQWDTGAILAQRETPIGETETADELHDRLAQLGAELIVETLRDLERGAIQPRVQDIALASRARKLTKADSAVDWSQPARRVARWINGLWSWPGAACTFVLQRGVSQSSVSQNSVAQGGKRERVLLVRARVAEEGMPNVIPLPPREGVGGGSGVFLPDLTVQAGAGRVELLEVKPAGGKLMPFRAYANGRRIQAGDRLMPPEEP
jgi:methionyl-tRNA formyltransferase